MDVKINNTSKQKPSNHVYPTTSESLLPKTSTRIFPLWPLLGDSTNWRQSVFHQSLLCSCWSSVSFSNHQASLASLKRTEQIMLILSLFSLHQRFIFDHSLWMHSVHSWVVAFMNASSPVRRRRRHVLDLTQRAIYGDATHVDGAAWIEFY